MRRRTDSDIVSENIGCLLTSVFFVAIGIFVVVLPLIWQPVSYDLLQTKDVVIEKFDRHYGGRHGASYDYIRTVDGERFNISGEYERERLEELLTKGTVVTIKWYKNKPFGAYLAEEIYVDGERVVTYDNDEPIVWWPRWLLGVSSSVVGIFGLLWFNFILKTNKKRQKKRDERIMRKYGKL